MHMMKTYENLQAMLEREIAEIEKKRDLDPQSLDNLNKLMAALKNTEKCMEYEESGESYGNRMSYGRSYDGMSNRMMPHYAYDNGMSMARRGRDGDGDGRYSEDNFRDSSYRGRGAYENSYGYSRDNSRKKMVEKLTTLMDDTMSEHDRNAIMDCIDKIK
jgi:hypothetical protein